jgi:hypothetical protein
MISEVPARFSVLRGKGALVVRELLLAISRVFLVLRLVAFTSYLGANGRQTSPPLLQPAPVPGPVISAPGTPPPPPPAPPPGPESAPRPARSLEGGNGTQTIAMKCTQLASQTRRDMDGDLPLHAAARVGDTIKCTRLVREGAKIDAR